MASFLDDLIGGFTGQQSTPQQTIIPTGELIAQSNAALTGQVAPGLLAFNQALAPGLTDVQLGVTNQLDPSILANYRGANSSILNQLNLGSSMSPELQAEITRNLLETNAATGFGASAGGVGGVLYQTAIDKQNLLRQRQQDALAAGAGGLAQSNRLYDPQAYTGMGAQLQANLANQIQGEQAARDEYVNLAEDIRRQNFSSLINTGGRLLGTAGGAFIGSAGGPMGAIMGAQAGSAALGGLFGGSRVAGQQQPTAPGGGNILSGLMGLFGGGRGPAVGGPGYGIGSGIGPAASDSAFGSQFAGFV